MSRPHPAPLCQPRHPQNGTQWSRPVPAPPGPSRTGAPPPAPASCTLPRSLPTSHPPAPEIRTSSFIPEVPSPSSSRQAGPGFVLRPQLPPAWVPCPDPLPTGLCPPLPPLHLNSARHATRWLTGMVNTTQGAFGGRRAGAGCQGPATSHPPQGKLRTVSQRGKWPQQGAAEVAPRGPAPAPLPSGDRGRAPATGDRVLGLPPPLSDNSLPLDSLPPASASTHSVPCWPAARAVSPPPSPPEGPDSDYPDQAWQSERVRRHQAAEQQTRVLAQFGRPHVQGHGMGSVVSPEASLPGLQMASPCGLTGSVSLFLKIQSDWIRTPWWPHLAFTTF